MSLPSKENFSDWYNEILREAEIMDVRYPVKGMYVWNPFGYSLKDSTYDLLRESLEARGHEEAQFPLLIPKTELMKEAQHIADFEKEVFWVDRAGVDELEEPLALRPTSETAIYPMFELWIRSHADLPLKVYQVVNTFRYETKHTRPLIRLREITSFKEAHTAHESAEAAEEQVEEASSAYREFFDAVGVPYVEVKRPPWDKFPGAEYTMAFDTLMPNGRALQIGTVHNLSTNFADTFDITFEDRNGEQQPVHQTCYGISERCVASVIGIHGDDNGLRLPPSVAPVEVAVVPILFSDSEEEVMEAAEDVADGLEEAGLEVEIDDSDDNPGSKFYRWEMKGAPARVEIGPRDIDEGHAKVVTRDGEEEFVDLDSVAEEVPELLETYRESLFSEAEERFEDGKVEVSSMEEAEEVVGEAIAVLEWCGDEACGQAMEDELDGDLLGTFVGEEAEEECARCGEDAEHVGAVARTY